jgi:hypothetical protein
MGGSRVVASFLEKLVMVHALSPSSNWPSNGHRASGRVGANAAPHCLRNLQPFKLEIASRGFGLRVVHNVPLNVGGADIRRRLGIFTIEWVGS